MSADQLAFAAAATSPLAYPVAAALSTTVKEAWWALRARLNPDLLEQDDDLMAIATAVGVQVGAIGAGTDLGTFVMLPGPTLADTLPLPRVSRLRLVEHVECEGGDCDEVLCLCEGVDLVGPCRGTVARACLHLELLCERCRPACSLCRQDARDDAGVR